MNAIIVVVGVPGSGKSTILSAVKEKMGLVEIVNYGKVMLDVAKKDEIERDLLRRLPTEEQARIGQKAAEAIVKEANGRCVIVDTHALIQSPKGFVPGLPQPVLQVLKPKAICVIEAPAEFVLKCREQDKQRYREQVSIAEIELHQELTRQFAVSCAAMSGCILQIIENHGQKPAEIAKPLLAWMD